MSQLADFAIRDEGTIVVFTPLSPRAVEWLERNTASEAWQWLGQSLCVDHRPAQGLVEALQNEGFDLVRA